MRAGPAGGRAGVGGGQVAEQVVEVKGRFYLDPPKTDAGRRTVTLPAVAAGALEDHMALHAEPGPDGLVFPAAGGGYLRHSNFARRVWAPATRAAKVEGLRFHDLRHTAATLAVAAGANTRELMSRMGHSSPAAALRYQHVMEGRDGAIASGLDALIQAAAALVSQESEAPEATHESAGAAGTAPGQAGSGARRECADQG